MTTPRTPRTSTIPAPTNTPTPEVRSLATIDVTGLPPIEDHRSDDGGMMLPTTLTVEWTTRPNGDVPAPWTLALTGPTLKADGTPSKRTHGAHSFTLRRDTFNVTTKKTVPPLWVLDLLDTLGIPTDEARAMHAEATDGASPAPTPSDAALATAAETASTRLGKKAEHARAEALAATTESSLHDLASRVLDAAAKHDGVVAVSILDWDEDDEDHNQDSVDVDVREALDANGDEIATIGGAAGAVPISALSDLDPFIDPEVSTTDLSVERVRAWVIEQTTRGAAPTR